MKNSFVCLIIIFVLTTGNICGQIQKISNTDKKVERFKKTEWTIALKARFDDPFLINEIELDMIILPSAGNKYILPCFFISGKSGETSIWKARLAPMQAGIHRFYFILKEKGVKTDSSTMAEFRVENSVAKGILHPADYWTFQFANGEHFRGIGENIGWESRDSDDSKYFKDLHENPRFNYEYMLKKLASLGGNFFRTWMCPWNLPLEWKNPENNRRYKSSDEHFNPSAIGKMERLVELCDSLGLHFMLSIDAHGNFMGDAWKQSNYNKLNGGPAETVKDFFTDEKSRIQYKSKLRYLVARWGYSPAVGAWEFFNEIDNAIYGPKDSILISHEIITKWHDEMSTYLKNTDPYRHIVTTSISHRDIEGLNNLKNMDVNQKHIYRNTAAIPNVIASYIKTGKPYVIGEYGYHWDWSLDFNKYAGEFDDDFKKGLWYGLFSPTPVLPMTWWWEFFDERGTTAYFSRVRKIYDLMMKAGNGKFSSLPAEVDHKSVKTFGVACGSKVFIYLVNQDKEDLSINLTFDPGSLRINHLQQFNTYTGEFEKTANLKKVNAVQMVKDLKLGGNKDLILILD